MILDLLGAIKSTILAEGSITNIKVTNYQFFTPNIYPCVALDVLGGVLANDTYSLEVQDSQYSISVVYLEEVPTNRDKEPFLENVEKLMKLLAQSVEITGMIQGIRISCNNRDRGKGDNMEFISEINIVGSIEI